MPSVITAYGRTDVDSWQPYDGADGPGLFVDVHIKPYPFPRTPNYTATIHGTGSQWDTIGVTSIYMPTPTGLRVYIRRPDASPIDTTDAATYGWHVRWEATFVPYTYDPWK
jgi:hypothetical protein